MPRDMQTVYRAADIAEADIIVAWLERYGITAHVKDRFAAGTLHTSLIVAPQGIEVCVVDADDAVRAVALVRDHRKQEERREAGADTGHTIEAVCAECGNTVSFLFAQRGSVQACPHCGSHVDVPDETGT